MGLLAFASALTMTSIDENKRLWLTAALAVASVYFTWASTFNNHIMAASQLMIGFWFLLKAKRSCSIRKNLFFAGFFLSLAGAMDAPIGAFYVGFFGYVLLQGNLRRNVFFYMIPITMTVVPTLLHTYQISGSIMPVQTNEAFFDYPGSPWIEAQELSGMSINEGVFFLKYGFSALLGTKGFLLYNPFLFIALPYLFLEIKKKRAFKHEATVIGGASIIIVLYYLLFTNNYGGSSYSIRWFVPLLPVLFFFIYPFFEEFTKKRYRIFITLFIFSTLIAGIGLINPWSVAQLSDTPVISNLIELHNYLNR